MSFPFSRETYRDSLKENNSQGGIHAPQPHTPSSRGSCLPSCTSHSRAMPTPMQPSMHVGKLTHASQLTSIQLTTKKEIS